MDDPCKTLATTGRGDPAFATVLDRAPGAALLPLPPNLLEGIAARLGRSGQPPSLQLRHPAPANPAFVTITDAAQPRERLAMTPAGCVWITLPAASGLDVADVITANAIAATPKRLVVRKVSTTDNGTLIVLAQKNNDLCNRPDRTDLTAPSVASLNVGWSFEGRRADNFEWYPLILSTDPD